MEPRLNRLFLPSARQTNILLIVGFGALGYALYVRYMGIEQSGVGLACNAGLDTWMCAQRRVLAALFDRSIIGAAAVIVAAVNLLRPTLVVFAVGLAVACIGVVLYNVMLSALAIGVLLLSFARRAPEPD
ncbi:MAG: hypothetical protein JSR61_12475 [Proteobacteria bacterium]|nr:hypothetical protein [Pseudomonadota bacterium]